MGPDTSAEFILDLIRKASRERRPAILHWNVPLDLEKEREFIATGAHTDHYRRLLSHGAQRLVAGGVTRIVMPCNTAHEFHPELSSNLHVPFPNLIRLVGDEIERRAWEKILLLATSRTIATGLYQNVLAPTGVEIAVPNPESQTKLDLLIQGLLGNHAVTEGKGLIEALKTQAGVDKVVLGCTDLQLVIQPSEKVIDSMQCLVDDTVKHLLEN